MQTQNLVASDAQQPIADEKEESKGTQEFS